MSFNPGRIEGGGGSDDTSDTEEDTTDTEPDTTEAEPETTEPDTSRTVEGPGGVERDFDTGAPEPDPSPPEPEESESDTDASPSPPEGITSPSSPDPDPPSEPDPPSVPDFEESESDTSTSEPDPPDVVEGPGGVDRDLDTGAPVDEDQTDAPEPDAPRTVEGPGGAQRNLETNEPEAEPEAPEPDTDTSDITADDIGGTITGSAVSDEPEPTQTQSVSSATTRSQAIQRDTQRRNAGELEADEDIADSLTSGGFLDDGREQLNEATVENPIEQDELADLSEDEIKRQVAEANPGLSPRDVVVEQGQDGSVRFSTDIDAQDARELVAAQNDGIAPDEVQFDQQGNAYATQSGFDPLSGEFVPNEQDLRGASQQFQEGVGVVSEIGGEVFNAITFTNDPEGAVESAGTLFDAAKAATRSGSIPDRADAFYGEIQDDQGQESVSESAFEGVVQGVGAVGDAPGLVLQGENVAEFTGGVTANVGENPAETAETATVVAGETTAEAGKALATSARQNPAGTLGMITGGVVTGLGTGALASRGIYRVGRRFKTRTSSVGGEDIDAEELTSEEVLEGEERFPSSDDPEATREDPAEQIIDQAEENTPTEIEQQFEEAGVEGDADLKKTLDQEPEGPGDKRTAQGLSTPEQGSELAEQYETTGTSAGPELSPNFLGLDSTPDYSLRPGIPRFGNQPTAVVVRTDVENPDARTVDEFDQELRRADEAGDPTALAIRSEFDNDDFDPVAEAEAQFPPGTDFVDVGSGPVRDRLRRLGIGSDFRTDIDGNRIPIRTVAPEGEVDGGTRTLRDLLDDDRAQAGTGTAGTSRVSRDISVRRGSTPDETPSTPIPPSSASPGGFNSDPSGTSSDIGQSGSGTPSSPSDPPSSPPSGSGTGSGTGGSGFGGSGGGSGTDVSPPGDSGPGTSIDIGGSGGGSGGGDSGGSGGPGGSGGGGGDSGGSGGGSTGTFGGSGGGDGGGSGRGQGTLSLFGGESANRRRPRLPGPDQDADDRERDFGTIGSRNPYGTDFINPLTGDVLRTDLETED